jgi:hypothetical protein
VANTSINMEGITIRGSGLQLDAIRRILTVIGKSKILH